MGNPNSITSNSSLDKLTDFIGNDSEKNNDVKATNQKRGKNTLKGVDRTKRIEELTKEISELKAKLLANGVDPEKIEEIEKRVHADERAANSQKPVKTQTKSVEPKPEPKPAEPELTEDTYDNNVFYDEEMPTHYPEVPPAVVGKKSPKNKGFKRKITTALIGLIATTAVGTGIFFTLDKGKKAIAKNPTATEENIALDDGVIVIPSVDSEDIPDQETIKEAETIGIKDGYDEEDMWCSDSKPNPVAFADFKSVIKNFGGDVKAAAKYTCDNEVEVKTDYIAGLDAMRPAAFKGLSELQISDKLEHLSPEEFSKISQEFNSILDKADNVKEISLNGKYSNAYMAIKDGKSLVGSKIAKNKGLAINHETMQLIQCATNEKGAKAYQLEWHDENGKLIDSIIIKEACAQVVEKEGSNPTRFKDLPEVTEESVQAETPITPTGGPANVEKPPEEKKDNHHHEKDEEKEKDEEEETTPPDVSPVVPPTPTPPPPPVVPPVVPPTPPPDIPPIIPPNEHEQKDEGKERENAGDNVDQRDIDNNVTPPTTKEEDQRNADEIEKRRQAEEAARREAERIAEEQRRAEEAATRRETENREVADESNEEETRDADQDKERAEDEASREQEEAAKEERENREEQERREEAQEEANEKAEENEQEAESHADDTASERADAFNNGDF